MNQPASDSASNSDPYQDLETDAANAKQSRIISRVLSPAIRLWLRSQVESVESLQFEITGGDKQILRGHIPQVAIAAQRAVYQGLHLSQIQLVGTGIRVNLGQVMRGKSLRLLDVVPLNGELIMHEQDLNASLQAPLLATALTNFLQKLLFSGDTADLLGSDLDDQEAALDLRNPRIWIESDQLRLSADLISDRGVATPFALRTGLTLHKGNALKLQHPQWLPHAQAKRGLPLTDLHEFIIDLGSDVELQEVSLHDQQIVCRGRINVIPVEA